MFKIASWLMLNLLAGFTNAANSTTTPTTHYLDWTVTWQTAAPDNVSRLVPAINGEFPLPIVRVNMGDRIVATVRNNLSDPERLSTIHWHGLFQNGTNDMDGVPSLTQCPGAVNDTFIYNFTVDQPGTYWYHTHIENLYPDGYRQLLLVDNDGAWFEDQVDEEIAFTLTDWYNELTETIFTDQFMVIYNPTGAEPIPDAILFNETYSPRWEVKPNTTYRLRIANIGAFSAFYFYIPGYNFTIVEVDGIYTEPAEADLIFIATAQRYSLLLTTGPETDQVIQMVQIADSSLYDIVPPTLQLNRTGFLYSGSPDESMFVQLNNSDIFETAPVWNLTDNSEVAGVLDDLSEDSYTSDNLHWFDDMELVPYDHMPLLEPVDLNHTLHLTMTVLDNGNPYAFLNDITYTAPSIPAIFSTLSAPDDDTALNATIYGSNTNSLVLEHNQVIQMILNNDDTGKHPFHMHGHVFQCVKRGADMGQDTFVPYNETEDDGNYPQYPMTRDTFVVLPNSYFLIRFRADNPGIWFFHCHIDWHMSQGLAMVLVEAPVQLRQNYKVHPIMDNHLQNCQAVSMNTTGNAAGNTANFFDLAGEPKQAKDLPPGFTARGIVALVFSIICAFVGLGFLIWYGTTDTPEAEAREAERIMEAELQDATAETRSYIEAAIHGNYADEEYPDSSIEQNEELDQLQQEELQAQQKKHKFRFNMFRKNKQDGDETIDESVYRN